MTTISIDALSDRELLERIGKAANDERRLTAELLALLGEVDSRRLYLGLGCSSLFTFCTHVLRFSEHAAYHRIEAARAARRFPTILGLVADGSVTLTTVALLRPHLTADDHKELLAAARHKSKREVEHQVACLAPRPDVPTLIRRLSADKQAKKLISEATEQIAPAPRPVVPMPPTPAPKIAPLASDRYLLRVTLSVETHAKLRRAQALMGHRVPNGDPAVILDKALTLLVAELERAKAASVSRPRAASKRPAAALSASSSGSRHIPAEIRRQVWRRDEGRCAFVGSHGRCGETSRLEFHHLVPFARGGPTTLENLALRCRAHNRYESEGAFGPWPAPTFAERRPLDSA